MPPEQVLNPGDLDVRTDLYALGATFFELLIGSPPFDGANPGAILRSKQLGAAPPAGKRRDDLPPPLAECLDALLSQHPEHRPDHPRQIVRRLQTLAADENVHD
jgi:serine/threonine-protein kinase